MVRGGGGGGGVALSLGVVLSLGWGVALSLGWGVVLSLGWGVALAERMNQCGWGFFHLRGFLKRAAGELNWYQAGEGSGKFKKGRLSKVE